VETKLQRIAEKARKEPSFKFTSLFHLMNTEFLRGCFERLRKDAASGIDRVTKEEYGKDLDANLSALAERLHRMSYIPQPVRRVYIPKPGSTKQRPLGIPALEDKLVQLGLVRILEAIYEGDFIDDSYGFRRNRGCHDALCALGLEVEGGKVHYIVEADIKGFFDNVQHDWMMEFLGHRIGDKRVLRYVKRFLIGGVLEDGKVYATEQGTPQGGIISPMLANIYLHYALDLCSRGRSPRTATGELVSSGTLTTLWSAFGLRATQSGSGRFWTGGLPSLGSKCRPRRPRFWSLVHWPGLGQEPGAKSPRHSTFWD